MAIENKDVAVVEQLLKQEPEVWGSEHKRLLQAHGNDEFSNVTLMRKLAIEGFDQGIRKYADLCWPFISREDTWDVLRWCITVKATRCARVLLESALEPTPTSITSHEVFMISNYLRLYDVAEMAARMTSFEVKDQFRAYDNNLQMRFWRLALHAAVSHHQLGQVRILLVERGAEVNALDN